MEKESGGTPSGKQFNDGQPGPGAPKGVKRRPRRLLDMMHVYRTDKPGEAYPADSPGRAAQRKFFREDTKGFLQMMNAMEKEFQAKLEKVEEKEQVVKPGERSEGTQPLLELIERLLTEYEEQV